MLDKNTQQNTHLAHTNVLKIPATKLVTCGDRTFQKAAFYEMELALYKMIIIIIIKCDTVSVVFELSVTRIVNCVLTLLYVWRWTGMPMDN